MPDYKKLYFLLVNEIMDAVEKLEADAPEVARSLLISAQQKAEALFLSSED